MSNFSATIAPNRCVLRNTGNVNVPIGCCENPRELRRRAAKNFRKRARNTPNGQVQEVPASGSRQRLASVATQCGCGRKRCRGC